MSLAMHRRNFIKWSVALALGTRGWGATVLTSAHRPLGIQLYTVMAQLEQDFEGTLRAVAELGYREVETIGAFGRDPRFVRDLLDKYGLKSPSQHMAPGDLYGIFSRRDPRNKDPEALKKRCLELLTPDRVDSVLEEAVSIAKALGQKNVIWAIIWPEQFATPALLDKFCQALNKGGELCAREGVVLGFHNHNSEFIPINGIVPYDVLLENTDHGTVKFEMDFYWATKAKVDPRRYFSKYPGRYTQCHLKDTTPEGEITTVGKGVVDFDGLLQAARQAGIEHYYVEFDRSTDPMTVIRESYKYLEKFF
jgi:sugar phosphate isomerase/epimerase